MMRKPRLFFQKMLLLTAAVFLLTSCGQSKQQNLMETIWQDSKFVYLVPWFTDYDTVLQNYPQEKLDPESDDFEDWRNVFVEENGYRYLTPDETFTFYGVKFEPTYAFQEDAQLYMGEFCSIMTLDKEAKLYDSMLKSLLSDFYEQFDNPSIPSMDDCLELLADTQIKRAGAYWLDDSGAVVQLIVHHSDNRVAFDILIGQSAYMKLLSGNVS